MRNWITDKFGRNRIRTRPANTTVPSTAPAPPTPIASRAQDVADYWYHSTRYGTITMSNPPSAGSNWVSRYYVSGGTQWIEYSTFIPSYPEHIRLPEGA